MKDERAQVREGLVRVPLLAATALASLVLTRCVIVGVEAPWTLAEILGCSAVALSGLLASAYVAHRLEGRVVAALAETERAVAKVARANHMLMQSRDRTIEALDEARRASEAKSLFLAKVSHELRTPLNAIMGYTHLIREDAELDPGRPLSEAGADLACIDEGSRHLLSLIDDILDLSKIEAGQMSVHHEVVAPRPLFLDVLESVRPLAGAGKNRLVLDDQLGSIQLYVDRRKLRQILLNLLSNASKFTRGGEVVMRAVASRDGVSICVSDTGSGIPEGELEHIFEAFRQVDESFTRRHDGTGLGLAISREFATLMKGSLTAASVVGEGSTFTLRLPMSVLVFGDITLDESLDEEEGYIARTLQFTRPAS